MPQSASGTDVVVAVNLPVAAQEVRKEAGRPRRNRKLLGWLRLSAAVAAAENDIVWLCALFLYVCVACTTLH